MPLARINLGDERSLTATRGQPPPQVRPPRSPNGTDGDVEALILMTSLADELDAAIAEAVKGLGGCGYSWAEIGVRLGITRQAAQQRWGAFS